MVWQCKTFGVPERMAETLLSGGAVLRGTIRPTRKMITESTALIIFVAEGFFGRFRFTRQNWRVAFDVSRCRSEEQRQHIRPTFGPNDLAEALTEPLDFRLVRLEEDSVGHCR